MVIEQGARLRAERLRLGLSQEALGALADVSKKSVINYEQGERSPDGRFFAAIAAAGADVLYILTGRRSQAVTEVQLLPEGDRILLDNFHAAPPQVQAGIKTTLGAFASAGAGATRRRRA